MAELSHAAGLAHRSAGDSEDRVALLVHGYPESSHMWHAVLPALADAGWRAPRRTCRATATQSPGRRRGRYLNPVM